MNASGQAPCAPGHRPHCRPTRGDPRSSARWRHGARPTWWRSAERSRQRIVPERVRARCNGGVRSATRGRTRQLHEPTQMRTRPVPQPGPRRAGPMHSRLRSRTGPLHKRLRRRTGSLQKWGFPRCFCTFWLREPGRPRCTIAREGGRGQCTIAREAGRGRCPIAHEGARGRCTTDPRRERGPCRGCLRSWTASGRMAWLRECLVAMASSAAPCGCPRGLAHRLLQGV